MTRPEQNNFGPNEEWAANPTEVNEPIRAAIDEMNAQPPAQIINDLKKRVGRSESGAAYALLKGENPDEYSDSEALVIFNPFANAATPNMLVGAEFVRRAAKYSDIRDSTGKLQPVMLLASPGLKGSKLRLSEDERHEVAEGELGHVSRELLRAVDEQGLGRVSLLGFSQGADLALAGARSRYSGNVDVRAVGVGDPATVASRPMPTLARDFFEAGAGDLKRVVESTGLIAQKQALGSGAIDFARFGVSAAFPSNLMLFKGLGHDTFEERVQEIIDEGNAHTTIAYGSESSIAKPQDIEPAMQRLYNRNGQESFTSVRINGGTHTWGNQLAVVAELYARTASAHRGD